MEVLFGAVQGGVGCSVVRTLNPKQVLFVLYCPRLKVGSISVPCSLAAPHVCLYSGSPISDGNAAEYECAVHVADH